MLRQEEHVPAGGERERGEKHARNFAIRSEVEVKYSIVLYSSHGKTRELNNVLFAIDV